MPYTAVPVFRWGPLRAICALCGVVSCIKWKCDTRGTITQPAPPPAGHPDQLRRTMRCANSQSRLFSNRLARHWSARSATNPHAKTILFSWSAYASGRLARLQATANDNDNGNGDVSTCRRDNTQWYTVAAAARFVVQTAEQIHARAHEHECVRHGNE